MTIGQNKKGLEQTQAKTSVPPAKIAAGQKHEKTEAQIGTSPSNADASGSTQGLSMKKTSTKKSRVTVAKIPISMTMNKLSPTKTTDKSRESASAPDTSAATSLLVSAMVVDCKLLYRLQVKECF